MNVTTWISRECLFVAVGAGMLLASACVSPNENVDGNSKTPGGESQASLKPQCETLMDCLVECGQDLNCADTCIGDEADACMDAMVPPSGQVPQGCDELLECAEACDTDLACLLECQNKHKDDCPVLKPVSDIHIPQACHDMFDCVEQCGMGDFTCAQTCMTQHQQDCSVLQSLPPIGDLQACQTMFECVQQCSGGDLDCAQECVTTHAEKCPVVDPQSMPELPTACKDLVDCLGTCSMSDMACANACFEAANDPTAEGAICPVVDLPTFSPQLTTACEDMLDCFMDCGSDFSCSQECLDTDGGQCGMVSMP
jgi:hypothetical protein